MSAVRCRSATAQRRRGETARGSAERAAAVSAPRDGRVPPQRRDADMVQFGSPVDVVILAGTVLLWIFFVGWPWLRLGREIVRPSVDEWAAVKKQIDKLDRATALGMKTWSEATRQALGVVLTNEPGKGRLANAPIAAEIVASQGEGQARALRALSTLSILCGLVGTAATFCAAFLPTLFGSAVDARGIVSHLGLIYCVNAIAILLGACLFSAHRKLRQDAERAAAQAMRVISALEECETSEEDDRLCRLLDRVCEKLGDWSAEAVEEQTRKFDEVVDEVRGLAGGIRELAKEIVTLNSSADGTTLAAIHEVGGAVESLADRMNQGLQSLAQPFLQGVPAFEGMTRVSDELVRLSETLRSDALRDAVDGLSRSSERTQSAVERLEAVAQSIPDQLREATSSIESRTAAGVRDGAAAGLSEAANRLDAAARGAGEAVAAQMRGLSGEVAAARAAQAAAAEAQGLALKSERAAVDALAASVKSLESALRDVSRGAVSARAFAEFQGSVRDLQGQMAQLAESMQKRPRGLWIGA